MFSQVTWMSMSSVQKHDTELKWMNDMCENQCHIWIKQSNRYSNWSYITFQFLQFGKHFRKLLRLGLYVSRWTNKTFSFNKNNAKYRTKTVACTGIYWYAKTVSQLWEIFQRSFINVWCKNRHITSNLIIFESTNGIWLGLSIFFKQFSGYLSKFWKDIRSIITLIFFVAIST